VPSTLKSKIQEATSEKLSQSEIVTNLHANEGVEQDEEKLQEILCRLQT
jgi:hypothetical protein